MAPAVAAIKEYLRLDLITEAKKKGAYTGKRLSELKEKHESVGDVRGIGLFWAVELVKNRKTKEPFTNPKDKLSGKASVLDRMASEMMSRGVYILNWLSHFVIAPPLIISRNEIDQGIDALDESLNISDKEIE